MQKTLIQCDFDMTVTDRDVSLLILDEFAGNNWHMLWDNYNDGKISLGEFNERAFGMVKAGRNEILDFIKNKFEVRRGFSQFVEYCRGKNYRIVIVSNGLDFYIEEVLRDIGWEDIEYHAAETVFLPGGLQARYINHDGMVLDSNFKLSYTKLFLSQGYRVAYVGDGNSDFIPAQKCQRIFATELLLKHCRDNKVKCTPFTSFLDVTAELQSW